MIKQLAILFVFCWICQQGICQQEQLYTLFIYNKQAFNPGYTGSDDEANINLLYRDQWNGFEGAPKTQLINFAMPLNDNKIGIGFNLVNHTIGIENRLTLDAIYAYHLKMGEGNLGIGLQASLRKYGLDFTDPRLVATQNIDLDPTIAGQSFSKNLYNFGLGLYYDTKVYYFGVAIPRLAKASLDFDNNDQFSEEVRHLNVMGGGAFALNDKLTLRPQVLYKWVSGAPYDIDVNLGLSFDEKYTTALTYRHGGKKGGFGESLDLIFSIRTSPNLLIAAAYDITLSEIRKNQNGSIELMANYNFGKKVVQDEIINPRYF